MATPRPYHWIVGLLKRSVATRFLLGVAASFIVVATGATRSVFVALGLAMLCYVFSEEITGVAAFRPSEVLAWLSVADDESSRFLVTTFLTVVGLLAAAWATSFTWRRGKRSELRLQAAHEIHDFFAVSSRSLNAIAVYADCLTKLHTECQTTADIMSVQAQARFLKTQESTLEDARKEVWRRSIEVHGLETKYGILFQDRWAASRAFEAAERGLRDAVNSMYLMPPWFLNDADFLQWISEQNPHSWQAFSTKWTTARDQIAFAVGFLMSHFQSDFVKPVFSPLWQIWRLFRSSR